MSKVIPFSELSRLHLINFLEHQRRDYQEREDYLARLRKLLFQVEGQMRQAEILQVEVFRQAGEQFRMPLKFPSQGDRLAMHRFFNEDPLVKVLRDFFAERLSAEACYAKIMEIKGEKDRK